MISPLRQRARQNLLSRSTSDGRHTYTTPGSLYPYAWGWDASVHAMGYANFDRERALQELEASVGGQTEEGMIAHITFYNHDESKAYYPGPDRWQKTAPSGTPISGISQPPLLAVALDTLWSKCSPQEKSELKERAGQIYQGAMRFQNWWYSERSPYGDGLVTTLHPWESGCDNSPSWSKPLQAVPTDQVEAYQRRDLKPDGSNRHERPTDLFYDQATAILQQLRSWDYSLKTQGHYDPEKLAQVHFSVADLCTNSLLGGSNEALLRLVPHFGKPEDAEQIKQWQAQTQKGLQKLWDPQQRAFFCYDYKAQESLPVVTSSSYLPLYAGAASPEQVEALGQRLEKLSQEGYGLVPSTDPASEQFRPQTYWQGPIWPHMNYFIAEGFARQGRPELAQQLRQDTLKQIEQHGMDEYFDPRPGQGQGLGAKDFGFTSAVYLQWT